MGIGAGGSGHDGSFKFYQGLTADLVAYAESQFKLDKKVKGSDLTQREVLEQVERQTGITPPELEGVPELPEPASHLMAWFYDLSATRSVGMALNPISYTEIEAWARLTGNKPAPWEVSAIRQLDAAFLQSCHEDQRKEATT